VAAGSVIIGDVPANSLSGGVPARTIRSLSE
jgi:acetyltransferase-like isoleucine patch superfamily enzyme